MCQCVQSQALDRVGKHKKKMWRLKMSYWQNSKEISEHLMLIDWAAMVGRVRDWFCNDNMSSNAIHMSCISSAMSKVKFALMSALDG